MRHLFGGSPSDYAMERVGMQLLLRPQSVGTVWDALTGGTQITDLTDLTGTPTTSVTADSDGAVSFYGPDGVTKLFVDFGYGRRYAMAAIDLGDSLDTFLAQGGLASGWAQLDSGGRLPLGQIPEQLGDLDADSLNVEATGRGGFVKTTSSTDHAMTVYQAAVSGMDVAVALNVICDNRESSAMYLTGHETIPRGTLKITHINGGATPTADAGASAVSVDLRPGTAGGTAAQGYFLTATLGPTTGSLASWRNTDPSTTEEFAVRYNGLTGIRIPVGNTPQGALEVRQRDTTTIGLVVQGAASTTAALMQVKTSAGTAVLEVGSSGAIVQRTVSFFTNSVQLGSTSTDFGGAGTPVISMKNASTAPTTNPTGGAIIYTQGGYLKARASDGTIFDSTKRTVSGAKGGNAALASLLSALVNAGLITDSTTA